MNKKLKYKWVNALRSGKYTQGAFELYNRHCNTYCCLGVLCEVMGLRRHKGKYLFPKTKTKNNHHYGDIDLNYIGDKEFGLSENCHSRLIAMNDGGYSFEKIASYISRYVK